jgi:hypothetical protein
LGLIGLQTEDEIEHIRRMMADADEESERDFQEQVTCV